MSEKKYGDTPGKDVRADLRVTLEEAVLGAKMPLTYTRTCICANCGGFGRESGTFIDCGKCGGTGKATAETKVEVTVPPGVSDGANLRLKGQGDEGDPDGELYVRVTAAAMNEGGIIYRRGADLYTDVPVVRFPAKGEATSIRVRTVEVGSEIGSARTM